VRVQEEEQQPYKEKNLAAKKQYKIDKAGQCFDPRAAPLSASV
jgi:hypothetical protein